MAETATAPDLAGSPELADPPNLPDLDAMRRFARCVTERLGVLDERLNDGPFPLSEARVLYELATREGDTASDLARRLRMDPGYLSRILKRFRAEGLVADGPAPETGDRRRRPLRLTDAGRAVFAPLETASRRAMAALAEPLAPLVRREMLQAMATVAAALPAEAEGDPSPVAIRSPEIGDLGWIVSRHAEIYGAEHSWGAKQETVVARIVADLGDTSNPERDRIWIAARGRRRLGCVALKDVGGAPSIGQLRILMVEPEARGLGLGRRLTETCVRFAAEAGYAAVDLWTVHTLTPARKLYADLGFELVEERPDETYDAGLTAERWRKTL